MATLVRTDGTIQTVLGAKRGILTLEQMQEAVDGYIEFAPTFGKQNVVVNEDGRLRGLPLNIVASQMAGAELVGNVLFCDDKEIE